MGARITGWGAVVPDGMLTNEELAPRVGVTEQWILERTGIHVRHIAGPGDTVASLATAAGARALESAQLDAADVDMVIVATCTPDSTLPAMAPLVQAALGAEASAFDINAGCSGFLYSLAQADASIAAGLARTVLVVGADVLSRVTDYTDARSCVLFGDGAGAAVIEHTEDGGRLGPFTLHSDGSRPELLHIPVETGKIRMVGREVYKRAVDAMSRSVLDILRTAGLGVSDVALVVAHQANARILEAVGQRLGFDQERVVLNIARYGNTSAASIPIAVSEAAAEGLLEQDDVVVLTAFGAGFVWGAGVMRWGVPPAEVKMLVGAGEAHA